MGSTHVPKSDPATRKAQDYRARPVRVPRHFHLLWDHELDELRPVLTIVRDRSDEVIGHWHALYVLHFGKDRTLSEHEFRGTFAPNLVSDMRDLLAKDMDSYAAHTVRVGELLAERKVPFSEVIASLHLYEESAYKVFPDSPRPGLNIYTAFDKLSHIRMILLADAYFRSESALAAARIQTLEREATQLSPQERSRFRGLVGASPLMGQLYERIEAAGQTHGTVLIVGESGSGKELAARAIHESGPSPRGPFVALNCAALPRDLIESELFGYKRGAFSGANLDYLGLFRAADGGTLFLDEVTEMSSEAQSKLLRALQERVVRPIGSANEVPVDVRLIASTNREPKRAMRSGQLRPDLYYRLQASVLRLPPLRQHLEDIPLLAEHFIALFNEKLKPKEPITGLEEDALNALKAYQWPGNVREFSNAIESAFTFGRSRVIALADLPGAISTCQPRFNPPSSVVLIGTFAEAERDIISRTLATTGGNKVAAARLLRISRKKLYAKIAKYDICDDRRR